MWLRGSTLDAVRNLSPSHGSGFTVCSFWVYGLWSLGNDHVQNRALCPKTCQLLEEVIPRHYHHAFFSALAPKTHVTKHHGELEKV